MANSLSRIEKLEKLKDPYPRDFPGRETIDSVLSEQFFNDITHLTSKPAPPIDKIFKIAGRISARRDHGRNIFFDIFDQTNSIQLHYIYDPSFISGPEPQWGDVRRAIREADIGDMIGVEGTIGANPRGEPLLLISNFITLAKALKDPPANFHGVKNPETRFRHREQDLLSSAETRELFKTRAQIVFEIRKYLNERDFIEIEAPVLQPIYGGATARPFKTKHNSLGQEFFLSISSELYLKRAMVGGFDRVYSFSRCFRNEGISPEHNPEFTNLEIFEACKTADDMVEFTTNLLKFLKMKFIPDHKIDLQFRKNLFSSDWPLSRKLPPQMPSVEESIRGIIPRPDRAEAWELYINDMEIASGASDLNDPREQEARLKKSEIDAKLTSPGNEKPDYDPYDQNYIEALEMGALPVAGVGIGIDRLCMLLLNKDNIRDIIMFPTLRQIPVDD